MRMSLSCMPRSGLTLIASSEGVWDGCAPGDTRGHSCRSQTRHGAAKREPFAARLEDGRGGTASRQQNKCAVGGHGYASVTTANSPNPCEAAPGTYAGISAGAAGVRYRTSNSSAAGTPGTCAENSRGSGTRRSNIGKQFETWTEHFARTTSFCTQRKRVRESSASRGLSTSPASPIGPLRQLPHSGDSRR